MAVLCVRKTTCLTLLNWVLLKLERSPQLGATNRCYELELQVDACVAHGSDFLFLFFGLRTCSRVSAQAVSLFHTPAPGRASLY